MIVFPNCKINLGLHILQKRSDGYHGLETIFYPIPLQDALEVIQNTSPGSADVEFSSSGLSIDMPPDQNICVRAYQVLKKEFPQLSPVKMHLHKTIPTGAGLGGGSADGAFTLLLLNKKFNLELQDEDLIRYALQLGSDCPFFIKNKPCYATGRGENLEAIELDLSSYKIVLIHPGIHISTAQAFSKIKPSKDRPDLKTIIQKPVDEWKDHLYNDFEDVVFADHPEIKKVKDHLLQQGAVYAAMSGSGSAVFGLFERNAKITTSLPGHYLIREI